MFSKLRRRTIHNQLSASATSLAHLLMSNDPPSDVEETLVRNMIQDMQSEITVIQLEIDKYPSNHRGRVTRLADRKATIIKSANAHKSVLSPFRKLPPELLQVIFRETYWNPTTTFALPWSLSQVCRLWRTIVLSTPILWSCITIDFNAKSTRQEARLKLVLQRSFNIDLRVKVSGLMNKGDGHLSLLSTLVAHSERWGHLDLELTMITEAITALQAVKGHLQRLSHLHLKFLKPRPMTIDIFHIAPRLEAVLIDNVFSFVRVDLPLRQLRSYVSKTFADGRGEEHTPLDAFANLESLGARWEHTLDRLEPRITFPRLKLLVILFSNATSADGFFERLILPSINAIHVWGNDDSIVLPLSSMISRSLPCNLHTLSIGTKSLQNPGNLTTLLLLTPQIEDLRIPLPPLLDLSNFFATPGSPVLLPKLQRLYIALHGSIPLWFHSPLSVLVTSRCDMASNTRALFPQKIRTLRFLKLKFTNGRECRLGYLAIQSFPPEDDLDSEVLAHVNSWAKILVEEIPLLSGHPTPQKMLINVMLWRRLEQLFNTIEAYNIPKGGYLHVSKLHFIMYKLNQSENSSIPGEKHYHFRIRAKALLDRWEPLLLKDARCYQWLNTDRDPNTLTYISKRAELRKSSTAIDLIYSHARMYEFLKGI